MSPFVSLHRLVFFFAYFFLVQKSIWTPDILQFFYTWCCSVLQLIKLRLIVLVDTNFLALGRLNVAGLTSLEGRCNLPPNLVFMLVKANLPNLIPAKFFVRCDRRSMMSMWGLPRLAHSECKWIANVQLVYEGLIQAHPNTRLLTSDIQGMIWG